MTADDGAALLPPEDERQLVVELSQLVLEQAAPEELLLFHETAKEYFEDPHAVLYPKRQDERVGFGLDVALLTPYALAVATQVVRFLASTLIDAGIDRSRPLVIRLVRRLLRRSDQPTRPEGGPEPLSPDQAGQLREITYQHAKGLGLPESQATLLADAVVGAVLVDR
jgi:hypothetical protein